MSDKPSHKINVDELADMFGLPRWDKIDDMNFDYYQECAESAANYLRSQHKNDDEPVSEDEEDTARSEGEFEAMREVFAQWHGGVMRAAENLFGEHGLDLVPLKVRGGGDKLPFTFRLVPRVSWPDAASKIRETVNGVGYFHFNTTKEFLRSGPYTAREAVLSHLHYVKRYPEVYGSTGAQRLYDQAWG